MASLKIVNKPCIVLKSVSCLLQMLKFWEEVILVVAGSLEQNTKNTEMEELGLLRLLCTGLFSAALLWI